MNFFKKIKQLIDLDNAIKEKKEQLEEYNNTLKNNIENEDILDKTFSNTSTNKDYTLHTDKHKLSQPELLMLHYADTFHTGNNVFQEFWKYRYDVEPQETIDKLLRLDYIKIGSNESSLKLKTISELKDILKIYNLPLSGNKNILIARILDKVSETELQKYCTVLRYELTGLGLETFSQNKNVVYAHRHPDYEIDEKYIFSSDPTVYDNAFDNMLIQAKLNLQEKQYGLFRNCCSSLANISNDKKDYHSQLKYLILVAYMDTSGICDQYAIEHNIIDPEKSDKYCCPYNIKEIDKAITLLNMDINDFISECCMIIDNFHLPYSYYSISRIKEYIINPILEIRECSFRFSCS